MNNSNYQAGQGFKKFCQRFALDKPTWFQRWMEDGDRGIVGPLKKK